MIQPISYSYQELLDRSKSLSWDNDQLKWKVYSLLNKVMPFKEISTCEKLFGDLKSDTLVTRPLFNMSMHLNLSRSYAQQMIYLAGERILTEISLIRQVVKPGMTVVDVGANIGYSTLLLRQLVGESGKIICIEPSPENLPELWANIVNNYIKNVTLYEVAVGAKQENIKFKEGINGGIDAENGIMEVFQFPLSDLLNEKVDFIKIDVEGYEGQVIEGGIDFLEKYRPRLLIEIHPNLLNKFGTNTSTIYKYLSNTYRSIRFFDQNRGKSIITKILSRYVSKLEVIEIKDIDKLLYLSDNKLHDWTFWLLAEN